jgi:hypothetical protein
MMAQPLSTASWLAEAESGRVKSIRPVVIPPMPEAMPSRTRRVVSVGEKYISVMVSVSIGVASPSRKGVVLDDTVQNCGMQ